MVASLIGLCWLSATVLLACAAHHRVRGGARAQAGRDLARAGWLAAAAIAPTLITIAAGSL
jgi:hypothetical protein